MISQKVKAIVESPSNGVIRKMFEEGALLKQKYGADKVYDFSIGNPDLDPPQKVVDAVMEVAAGTSEACIIDSLMAAAMVGAGTSYPDLTYTVALTTEEYGVGFRKGSDLVPEGIRSFVFID